MAVQKIKENIYSVGARDWDRKLFDELIPLPDGTSYNAYLIKGSEKTALIDTVDPSKENELLENLAELKIKKIDYIISQHAEQDHSGALPKILEIYPNAKIVTNEKCKEFLMSLLPIPNEKFITVKEGETLSLGDKNLEFLLTPWVHWPETMCSYLKEDKILFSCDFFGAHFATNELFALDEAKVCESAKRYYAEIMMPFRTTIKNNIEKIKKFDVKMIAPSHGPVYDKPEFIIAAYKEWVSDEVKNEVVLIYVSMHGSVGKMARHLMNSLTNKGITVKPFNLAQTDTGELAMALVSAATIVIGSPTVLIGPHPLAIYAAYLANALRPKLKFASVIGSYGWGGKMLDMIKGMLPNLKVELIDPVIIKGHPQDADFAALDKLAENILQKHKASGIAP